MAEQATSGGDPLPAPTGPYPVGRVAYHWRHASRDRASTPGSTATRELMVWIWYPAAPEPAATPAAYLPPGWEPVGQFWGFRTDDARAHAYQDAPVAPDQARYPVLLFSPSGFPPLVLAAMLEEIASHGYVVVGVNHTGESTITVFPDGRVVPMDARKMQPALGPFSGAPEPTMQGRAAIADEQTADLRFVVDQLGAGDPLDAGTARLAGRLELGRLGAFGHSLGGNAALELCRLDRRCPAAANLDGGIWTSVGTVGLKRPSLLIVSEHAEMRLPCSDLVRIGAFPTLAWCELERALTIGGWQTAYASSRPGYALLIRGSGHVSFMDVPFLTVVPGSMMAGGLATVRIDSRRAWRIICDHLLAFFGRHLNGEPAPLLDDPAAAYPEASVGSPEALLAGGPSAGSA
jgi:hypothetical protein